MRQNLTNTPKINNDSSTCVEDDIEDLEELDYGTDTDWKEEVESDVPEKRKRKGESTRKQ